MVFSAFWDSRCRQIIDVFQVLFPGLSLWCHRVLRTINHLLPMQINFKKITEEISIFCNFFEKFVFSAFWDSQCRQIIDFFQVFFPDLGLWWHRVMRKVTHHFPMQINFKKITEEISIFGHFSHFWAFSAALWAKFRVHPKNFFFDPSSQSRKENFWPFDYLAALIACEKILLKNRISK